MQQSLNHNIQRLTALLKNAENKKLLWEEMQIISKKAFELQDAIMADLDEIEASETDITKIQAAFAARESIWDMMKQITDRELALREKTHHKETPEEREKRHQEILSESEEHHCCCGHHHTEHEKCDCYNQDKSQCCQKGKKTCHKK